LLLSLTFAGSIKSRQASSGSYANPLKTLPGFDGSLPFSSYTGYINVNKEQTRRNFFWFVESQGNPETDPLVFWTNGGPGCSGLIGFWQESGPLKILPGLNVTLSDITWTKYANVIYIEQPTGVGFSYDTQSDQVYNNDTLSAEENFIFLEEFLVLFPEYVGRETWLTAESYGGVYIPMLTSYIADNTTSAIHQQLTGAMIGNPVYRCVSENETSTQMQIFYFHGLVDYNVYKNFSDNGCLEMHTPSEICTEIFTTAEMQIGGFDQELVGMGADDLFDDSKAEPALDPDDLYQSFCLGNGTLEFSKYINDDTCNPIGDLTSDYLNQYDVQTALGVNRTVWASCAGSGFHYTANGGSMIPYYQNFLSKLPDFKLMIYSGDIDIDTCPFPQTQQCLAELNSPTVSNWEPWYVNGNKAGYVTETANYTFATVTGAGHEVPTYQPLSAVKMFSRFLSDQQLVSDAERKERLLERMRRGAVKSSQEKRLKEFMRKNKF